VKGYKMRSLHVWVVVLAVITTVGILGAGRTSEVADDAVAMKVGVVLDATPTKLRFSLKNVGKEEFVCPPFMVGGNLIVCVAPDGTEVRISANKELPASQMVRVAPGETRYWDLEVVSDPRKTLPWKGTGWHQVYWMIGNHKSAPIWCYAVLPAEEAK
jgi:hypothetical protein